MLIERPIAFLRKCAGRPSVLDGLRSDIRHATRALHAAPAFSLVALATLTLAIGAATSIVSIVDAVSLRPLPFPRADRLVAVGEGLRREMADPRAEHRVAPQNFLDWRAQQTAFDGIAAIGYARVLLNAEDGREPEALAAQAVTHEFFSVLGVQPIAGRAFTPEHETDAHARAAVIAYSLWQRRFNGDPRIVGRYLHGQTADLEIIGVMPPGFEYPVGAPERTEVWLPHVLTMMTASAGTASAITCR